MKVLLFVQNDWNKRPPRMVARIFAGCNRWPMSAALKKASADRWWEVECENADAGRTLIALTELVAAARRYARSDESAPATLSGSIPAGRILASGGRSSGDRRAQPRLNTSAPLTPADIPGRNT